MKYYLVFNLLVYLKIGLFSILVSVSEFKTKKIFEKEAENRLQSEENKS